LISRCLLRISARLTTPKNRTRFLYPLTHDEPLEKCNIEYKSSRKERLSQIAEWCMKNGLTPRSPAWADKVYRFAASEWGVEPRTIHGYLKTLGQAYAWDKWHSFTLEPDPSPTSPARPRNARADPSMKQNVFDCLDHDASLKAKNLAELLGVEYEQKKGILWKYSSQWRGKRSGFGSLPSLGRVDHRAKWWTNVPDGLSEKRGLAVEKYGWYSTKNKNGDVYFRGQFGTICWHLNGRIELWLRERCNSKGNAATLLAKGFAELIRDDSVLHVCADKLHCLGADSTFDVNTQLPRFKITDFKKSHGVTISSDGSHPRSLEIRHTSPEYLAPYVELFAKDTSLAVLDAWKKYHRERVDINPLSI
jgi:hypothetical protein